MNNGPENRRSFRVIESVYIRYEVISDDEFRDGLEHRNYRQGNSESAQARLVDIDARLSEAMYRMGGDAEPIGRCLTLLNDKINVVMQELPGLRETRTALASSVPKSCDVGADGIVFPSDKKLQPDTKLAVQMLLAADNRYVETFCRVIRVTDPPQGNDPGTTPYGIAVEFHGMKRAQREVLIQHMFNRESETLRMRRLQIEEDD